MRRDNLLKLSLEGTRMFGKRAASRHWRGMISDFMDNQSYGAFMVNESDVQKIGQIGS